MRLPSTTQVQRDHLVVTYGKRQFSIYRDGVVYNNLDERPIPLYVFKLRDWYIGWA